MDPKWISLLAWTCSGCGGTKLHQQGRQYGLMDDGRNHVMSALQSPGISASHKGSAAYSMDLLAGESAPQVLEWAPWSALPSTVNHRLRLLS